MQAYIVVIYCILLLLLHTITNIMYIYMCYYIRINTYVCMYIYIFHLHTIPQKSTTDFALGCGSPSLSRTSHSEVRRCGSQIGPVGRDSTWSLLTSGFHGCWRQKPYQVVPKTKRNMSQNCSNHGKINTSFQSGPKLKSDPC
jgi:hypothetical protein